jgi:phage-related protein
MGVIIFNGVSSENYAIQVEHLPGYETPEKNYTIIHIPGRNGDLAIDEGSYKNTPRSYEIAIGSITKNFTSMANNVSRWLRSASGYARLEDSYEPDYYRLALYKEAGILTNILGHAGRAVVNFECKPQRFLKAGDKPITVTSGQILWNPTGYEAKPTIILSGIGAASLSVGAHTVTISNIGSSLTLNSDIEDAYNGSVNRNSDISLPNGIFPKLVAGDNTISFSGGISAVSIIPRWWTI